MKSFFNTCAIIRERTCPTIAWALADCHSPAISACMTARIGETAYIKWLYHPIRRCSSGYSWLNNQGFTHLYYFGPSIKRSTPRYFVCDDLGVHDVKCRWSVRCIICGAMSAIEFDPDKRLMPHAWEEPPHETLRKQSFDVWQTTMNHELYCLLCGAIWDPVPEGKVKLV